MGLFFIHLFFYSEKANNVLGFCDLLGRIIISIVGFTACEKTNTTEFSGIVNI